MTSPGSPGPAQSTFLHTQEITGLLVLPSSQSCDRVTHLEEWEQGSFTPRQMPFLFSHPSPLSCHTVLSYDQNFMGSHSLILNIFVKNFPLIITPPIPLSSWWKDSGHSHFVEALVSSISLLKSWETQGAVHAFLDYCVVPDVWSLHISLKSVVCPVTLTSWNLHGSCLVLISLIPSSQDTAPTHSTPVSTVLPSDEFHQGLHGPPQRLLPAVICPPPDMPRRNHDMDTV